MQGRDAQKPTPSRYKRYTSAVTHGPWAQIVAIVSVEKISGKACRPRPSDLSQEGAGLASAPDADRRGAPGAEEAALELALGERSTCSRLLRRDARARGHRRANFRDLGRPGTGQKVGMQVRGRCRADHKSDVSDRCIGRAARALHTRIRADRRVTAAPPESNS